MKNYRCGQQREKLLAVIKLLNTAREIKNKPLINVEAEIKKFRLELERGELW